MINLPVVASKRFPLAVLILSSCLMLLGAGCDDSDTSTGNSSDNTSSAVPFSMPFGDFEVEAGEPMQFVNEFTSVVQGLGIGLTDLSVDIEKTIRSARVDIPAAKFAQEEGTTATVTVRVAPAEERETVCQTGELYGPFIVTIVEDANLAVDQPTAVISQSTLGVVNRGNFVVCIEVVSPLEASVSGLNMAGNAKMCGEDPANLNGLWVGNYTCENVPCTSDGGEISLTISQSQEGYSATYVDDGDAKYEGTVCGNEFRYTGGAPGYSESGVFTLQSSNRAKKESDWIGNDAECGGHCTDNLVRSE